MKKKVDVVRRFDVERDYDFRGWSIKVPFFELDPGWRIGVLPPFGGAMARFIVEAGGETASVFLDCHNALGLYTDMDGNPIPYWEVGFIDDDVARCEMENTDELLDLIREALGESKYLGFDD